MNINEIRQLFYDKLKKEEFILDKTNVKILEIINASFIADEEVIFGKLNENYVKKEIEWYNKQSLNIYDMENPPSAWLTVANQQGEINSNYGYLIFNKHNFNQYKHCLEELNNNIYSRRAIMIYTRPSIWEDYKDNGKNDFICTNTVQYLIRDNKLHSIVQMRSNDVIFGYKNDRYWQKYVLDKLYNDLRKTYKNLEIGNIYWNVGSFHIYESHFYLIEKYFREREDNAKSLY